MEPGMMHAVDGEEERCAPEPAVAEIEGALEALARAATRVRVHEQIANEAEVPVDRAGAALLRRLAPCADGIRMGDLADRLEIDAPAVTRKAQQLEREGLVERLADPEDRRACRLRLSPAGREATARLLGAYRSHLSRVLAGWSAEDCQELARLLHKFADTIASTQEHRREH